MSSPRTAASRTKATSKNITSSLTTKFLLDYPLPTVAGMKTVLDDLGAKNPKIRELKPEDLLDTRFLRNLKDSGAIK